MKPSDCKTAHQAKMAAQGIYEARVVAVGVTGLVQSKLDDALFRLEHEYWKRADALARKPQRRKRG